MKSSMAALAFAITGAFAAPVADLTSDNIFDALTMSLVTKFDATTANGPGEGWLMSPPGLPRGAMVKFYQNNQLMNGQKGRSYVLEIHEDVDTKQVKAVTNARPILTKRQLAPVRPYSPAPRQTVSQQQPGYGVGAGVGNTIRPNAVVPAAPASLAVAAAPASINRPSAFLAPSSLQVPGQGGPTITGLITQAGQLIGQQIGVSIGGLIGSTLEEVVNQYFPPPGAPPAPAPKPAGGA